MFRFRQFQLAILVALAASMAALPTVASAGGSSGPLCSVIGNPTYLFSQPNPPVAALAIWAGETFRRHEAHGGGWAYGHSSSSFPTDYWVHSNEITC